MQVLSGMRASSSLFVLSIFLLLCWSALALSGGGSVESTQRVPWLIVGGGPHGVHVAARLLAEGVTKDLKIADDAPMLLSKWKARTGATGMEYLRSSATFHLDLKEDSLRRFGRRYGQNSMPQFSKDYERPRLDLFNQHCDDVIKQYQLEERHLQGRVTGLQLCDDHIEVDICAKDQEKSLGYTADHVVLALGNDRPAYPSWVTPDLLDTGKIQHLLDTDRGSEDPSCGSTTFQQSVAIIGGGITAAHKALQLAEQRRKVHLISRHSMKEQQFDTHQDWMMDRAAATRSVASGGSGLTKRQRQFEATACLKQRRQTILKERLPGTVTAAINRGTGGLQYAIKQHRIHWHQEEVESVAAIGDRLVLQLSGGETVQVDQIFLATGFGKRPPFGNIQIPEGMPVSDFDGYPTVNEQLQWGHDRLFVTGALAELELGPSARNIAGARMAAERIVQAFK